MREAMARGEYSKAALTGWAQASLEAEGFEYEQASEAADRCFAEHFEITIGT
jgi:hypothetical protein